MKPHKYNLEVTTLTPVSIGNGDTLSPYADYVYEERTKQAHLLNKELIDNRVEEEKLGDEYIDAIYASFDNNRSNFDLKSFLETRLKLESKDYARQSIPCYGMQRNYRREVKAMLKNNQQPYLAGSSIKGAIKTALLYDWLSHEGKSVFDRMMQDVLQAFDRCKREIGDIENISRRRNVSFNDKREIKRLQREILKKTKNLSREMDAQFNKLMNSEDDQWGRDFRHLRVGDTALFGKEAKCFQLSNRLHYRKGEVNIPVNLEAIPKGESSNMRLTIVAEMKNENLAFLNKEEGIKKLFARINNFSKDNVSMELDLLANNDWSDNVRKREREVFNIYGDFLEQQETRIKNADSKKEAYLCLGFGKSFFYNSIGMLVNDWDLEKVLPKDEIPVFKKYAKLFFLGKPGQRNFPMTRTVTNGGIPMGWVKLTKQ